MSEELTSADEERGRWWDETKQAIADMTRAQLVAYLASDCAIKAPAGADMLWLRYRLAYGLHAKMPWGNTVATRRAIVMLTLGKGSIETTRANGGLCMFSDIFSDARASEREKRKNEKDLALAAKRRAAKQGKD